MDNAAHTSEPIIRQAPQFTPPRTQQDRQGLNKAIRAEITAILDAQGTPHGPKRTQLFNRAFKDAKARIKRSMAKGRFSIAGY